MAINDVSIFSIRREVKIKVCSKDIGLSIIKRDNVKEEGLNTTFFFIFSIFLMFFL